MRKEERKALNEFAKEFKQLRKEFTLKEHAIDGIEFNTEEAWKWSNRLQYILDAFCSQVEDDEIVGFKGYR